MVDLKLKPYIEQNKQRLQHGRVIFCQETPTAVVVYQSYKLSIGRYAVVHQKFEGCSNFSLTRMSWIKTDDVSKWLGYKKESRGHFGCTHTKRRFRQYFEIGCSIHIQVISLRHKEEYEEAKKSSQVQLQWDPDHDPFGKSIVKRTIQLGIRADTLLKFASGEIIGSIEDITEFVKEQSAFVNADQIQGLMIPEEKVYPVFDEYTRKQIFVDI